jgi:hypothetical protein
MFKLEFSKKLNFFYFKFYFKFFLLFWYDDIKNKKYYINIFTSQKTF